MVARNELNKWQQDRDYLKGEKAACTAKGNLTADTEGLCTSRKVCQYVGHQGDDLGGVSMMDGQIT